MNIIILTQYYPPEIGAPQRRLSDLAERLVHAGYTVTVLTAMPNYPVGKIMKGYGGVIRREEIKGVKVIRTFIFPTQKTARLLRMLNYLSFVFSSLLFGTFLLPKADYLLVESPPLFLGITALLLSRVKRAQMIFNVSDIWPSGLARLNLISTNSIFYRMSIWLEAFCYRQAALVTCQTKGIKLEIDTRFPQTPTYHLSNGIAVEDFGLSKTTKSARDILSQKPNEIVLLYAGLHGLAQSLEQIIEAAGLMQDEPYQFIFVGDGPKKQELQKLAENLNLDNVKFLGTFPAQEIPSLLASADIIIVSLMATYREAVPSKLFEAMASEKPVLLVATSEACDIITEYKAGVIARPGDPEDIAANIRLLGKDPVLRKELGENARRAAEQKYNREYIARDFVSYLEQLRS